MIPVFDPALVEFFRVFPDEEGAALDLLKLLGSLLRLFRLAEPLGRFYGELSSPNTPPINVVPLVADIFPCASLFCAECLCNFLLCLILCVFA